MTVRPVEREVGARVKTVAVRAGIGDDSVVVIGAGVDVPFNLPTVSDLVRELAAFAQGDGKQIDAALRKKLPRVRLRFEKVGGDAGDQLVARLFDHPDDAVPALRAISSKLGGSASGPVGEILEALCTMASENRVKPSLVERLAQIAGEPTYIGAGENLLDPDRLVLTPLIRTATRRAFEYALLQTGELTPQERELLEDIVMATSNIENLLAFHFLRFSEASEFADRRTYLYLAWMLWSFLRVRSQGAKWPSPCFYEPLRVLRPKVVTFNYTNYLGSPLADRICHFHGALDHYLRMDDRSVVADDQRLHSAIDPKSVASFVEGLRLDVARGTEIDLPAIVPPLTFKPVLSRDQLLVWAAADGFLQRASAVAVVGYSFAQSDEHFNDLLRKGNPEARISVINPDLFGTAARACKVLNVDPNSLAARRDRAGREVLSAGRLACTRARGEEITRQDLADMLAV